MSDLFNSSEKPVAVVQASLLELIPGKGIVVHHVIQIRFFNHLNIIIFIKSNL
jgi:hypothetical protein